MIRSRRTPLPVQDCCRLLGVSRASYYRSRPPRGERPDEDLVRLAGAHPRYGYRRLAALAGIGRKAMRLRMGRLGLMVQRKKPRKRTTFPVPVEAPNLCRKPSRPGELLASDFTYIPLVQGFAYFAVTLDVFSRRVRGWSVSRRMDRGFVAQALRMAMGSGPLAPGWVCHSDRGSQYASAEFRDLVRAHGGASSFSGPASPSENAFAESFFARFKDEAVHIREPRGYQETVEEVERFVAWYNRDRLHSSLGDVSPLEFEERFAENPPEKSVS